MSWPPPPDSPFWNLPKKEQAEYEAVVERDGDWCVDCGGAWSSFHHVRYGVHERTADRENMILLCTLHHGTGEDGAHGPNAKAKQQEYLRYLNESSRATT